MLSVLHYDWHPPRKLRCVRHGEPRRQRIISDPHRYPVPMGSDSRYRAYVPTRVSPILRQERQAGGCSQVALPGPRTAGRFTIRPRRTGRDCCQPRIRADDDSSDVLYWRLDELLQRLYLQGQLQLSAHRRGNPATDDATTYCKSPDPNQCTQHTRGMVLTSV